MGEAEERIENLTKSLKRIETKLNRSARFEEHWKALEVMTHPIMGIGFFALALGVPMLVTGYGSTTWPERLSHLIGGGLVLLIGSASLALPIQMQSYFLEKPGRLAGFFRGLTKNKGNAFTYMRHWASEQGDAGRDVLRAIRTAERVVRIGWWTVMLAIAALLMLYLGLAALVIQRQWGVGAVAMYLGACVVLSVAAVLFRRRSPKAETPSKPSAGSKAT